MIDYIEREKKDHRGLTVCIIGYLLIISRYLQTVGLSE